MNQAISIRYMKRNVNKEDSGKDSGKNIKKGKYCLSSKLCSYISYV